MDENPTHHSFVIADIEGYGRRSDEDQRWLRNELYWVFQTSLMKADVPFAPKLTQDRGDSVILLVPGSEPKRNIGDALVQQLDRELTRHARRSSEPARMRLRLALHAGEVARDGRGWIGRDLNTACRLADLPAAREALAAEPDANLVVVVSDEWYRSVVRPDPVLVEHFAFRRVPFVVKEVDDHAWIHVPRKRP
ncbi:hypothetical protein ACFFQW_08740 [Umezawaea endophytica]|uniref:Guanylate cyclase domain-containing protein n=1 Tax=Umezawaea endophytica TaxID=1654476 RepID=A0A9X3ADE0_9PSEU|nr:hypothetical protein [Umezawaea endophytica]MCS7476072.1 hypothetical protein [Umezawaea endophytica]